MLLKIEISDLAVENIYFSIYIYCYENANILKNIELRPATWGTCDFLERSIMHLITRNIKKFLQK